VLELQDKMCGPLAVFNVDEGQQEARVKSPWNHLEASFLLSKLDKLFATHSAKQIGSIMILSFYRGQVTFSSELLCLIMHELLKCMNYSLCLIMHKLLKCMNYSLCLIMHELLKCINYSLCLIKHELLKWYPSCPSFTFATKFDELERQKRTLQLERLPLKWPCQMRKSQTGRSPDSNWAEPRERKIRGNGPINIITKLLASTFERYPSADPCYLENAFGRERDAAGGAHSGENGLCAAEGARGRRGCRGLYS
jgi:hypothetical protein